MSGKKRLCAFSDTAESDPTDIVLFIAADSPTQAVRFVADLRKHCSSLTENPERFRLREEYGAGIRVAVHGRYLIFYAIREDAVVIERVLHGARHLDWVQL